MRHPAALRVDDKARQCWRDVCYSRDLVKIIRRFPQCVLFQLTGVCLLKPVSGFILLCNYRVTGALLSAPASDGDCNLIRPIKKSFVKSDSLIELNKPSNPPAGLNPPSSPILWADADVLDVYATQPPY